MIFRFFRVHADLTVNKASSFWKIEAKNRDAAIQAFCREYGLELSEINGEPAWFCTADNAMLKYLVDEGRSG